MTRAAHTPITSDARTRNIGSIEIRWTVTPSAINAPRATKHPHITLRIDPHARTAIVTDPNTERWRTEFDDLRVLRTSACLHIRIPALLELVLINDQNHDEPLTPLYLRTDIPERIGLKGGRYDAPRVRIETNDND